MSFQSTITKSFPKIICIGKNYLKHVKEMGGSQVPSSPVIFLKPWSSLNYNPSVLSLPIAAEHKVDHELELGVFVKKGGKNIPKGQAFDHVGGYFIGIDFTDRDLQKHAKSQGLPWALAKGQDNFCPVSPLIAMQIDPYSLQLEIKVNGAVRQKDFAGNMHFKIDDIISYTSQFISLSEGDVILTGTPDGVGQVKIGDKIEAVGRVKEEVVASLCFQIVK